MSALTAESPEARLKRLVGAELRPTPPAQRNYLNQVQAVRDGVVLATGATRREAAERAISLHGGRR